MASVRGHPRRASDGARHSPMKEEVPAPVSTTRGRASASQCARNPASAESWETSWAICGHSCGCCVISRAVQYVPAASISPAVSFSRSMGLSPTGCGSVPIRETERVGASVRAVSDSHAALARSHVLTWRPGQVWVAVEVRARDRVTEVLALGEDLEAPADGVMHARRNPVEVIRDRRPPPYIGALVTGDCVARLVVPGDIGAEWPLLVDQTDRPGCRGRGIDGADEVAELIIAAGPRRGVLHARPEAILHDVLPCELYPGKSALHPVGRSCDGPWERYPLYRARRTAGVLQRAEIDVRLDGRVDVVLELLVEHCSREC